VKRPRTFADLEAQVIAEVICYPERSLPLAVDIELDHFAQVLHRACWEAIRNLEAMGAEITILQVVEYMHSTALGRHGREAVDELQLTRDVTEIVKRSPSYGTDHERRFREHLCELRAVADQRRLLMGGI